ncbi:MAG: hypothetical protein WC610_01695 [Patescibacteria group bacterium]
MFQQTKNAISALAQKMAKMVGRAVILTIVLSLVFALGIAAAIGFLLLGSKYWTLNLATLPGEEVTVVMVNSNIKMVAGQAVSDPRLVIRKKTGRQLDYLAKGNELQFQPGDTAVRTLSGKFAWISKPLSSGKESASAAPLKNVEHPDDEVLYESRPVKTHKRR